MQNCPKWPVCQSSNHPISGSSNTAAWIFHGVNTADFFFPNACASMRPAIMSVWIIKYNKWLVSSMRNGIQLRSQPAWLSECPTSGRSMGISNTREIRGVDMTGIIKGGGHNSRRACPWCTVFMMSCVFVQETWMNGCADGNGIAMKAAQKELSCGWVLDWVFFFSIENCTLVLYFAFILCLPPGSACTLRLTVLAAYTRQRCQSIQDFIAGFFLCECYGQNARLCWQFFHILRCKCLRFLCGKLL